MAASVAKAVTDRVGWNHTGDNTTRNQPAMRPPKILIGISGMRRTMAGERTFRPSFKLNNLHGAQQDSTIRDVLLPLTTSKAFV